MSPTKPLSDSEKLDLIVKAIAVLNAKIDDNQEEIVEKLSNLNLGGADYSIDTDEGFEDD